MMSKAVALYVKSCLSVSQWAACAVKYFYWVPGRCSSYPVVVTLEEKCMANDEPLQNPIPETPSPGLLINWKPSRLPELASNGLPFSPTFILPCSEKSLDATANYAGSARPFGFHYWRQHAIDNQPVIDLTRGYSSGKGGDVSITPAPSSREALPPPSPLRTTRASFPACRSSFSNAPCGTRFRDG